MGLKSKWSALYTCKALLDPRNCFDCPTHVKSMWVPAAWRKERQLMAEAAAGACWVIT